MTSGRRSLVGPTLVSIAFALFVGPGPLGVVGPWIITRWRMEDPLLGVTALRGVGVASIALGLPCLVYVDVVSLIVGQALLLGSPALLTYGAVIATGFHLFVLLYEEPTMRRTYGDEYDAYCRQVRRWLPRLRPAPTGDGR